MKALAAEIVINNGNNKPFPWGGVITDAVTRLLKEGRVPAEQTHSLIRAIRTHIHACRYGIWRKRNLITFDPDLEAERTKRNTERERIQRHIINNEKAQKQHLNVSQVMAMNDEQRTQWYSDTTDRHKRQLHLDDLFTLRDDTSAPATSQGNTAEDVIRVNTSAPTHRRDSLITDHFTSIQPATQDDDTREQSSRNDRPNAERGTQQRLAVSDGEARIVPPLKRPPKKRSSTLGPKKRSRSLGPSKMRTKRSRRPPARLPLLLAWTDVHKDVEDPYNDQCEKCDLGGSLVCCYSCECVWHRKCHERLRKKRNVDDYWQCDACMAEEKEMAGDISGNLQTWSEAGNGSGTNTQPTTTGSTNNEENAAWEEWQEDVRNDEGSEEDSSGGESSSAVSTAPNRVRKTRSARKQKICIATFFDKHTQSQNKRKRPETLEEVIGESTDEDSDDSTTPERTQQQTQSCAKTGNHRKGKKKKKKKVG